MRTRITLGIALLLSLATGLTHSHFRQRKGYGLEAQGQAPSFRLPSLAGEPIDLDSFRGKVVVLNFWATWCPPCVEEMPSLERLHLAGRSDDLVVLAVSVDEDEKALSDFVRNSRLTLPVLRDPAEEVSVKLYRVTGYPETFVIDPQGRVRDHVVGAADWSTPQAVAHLRAYRTAPASQP